MIVQIRHITYISCISKDRFSCGLGGTDTDYKVIRQIISVTNSWVYGLGRSSMPAKFLFYDVPSLQLTASGEFFFHKNYAKRDLNVGKKGMATEATM
jgi:hypothetical protein